VANDTSAVDAAKAELERAQNLDNSVKQQAAKPSGQYADAPYSLATELQNKGQSVKRYLDTGTMPPSSKSPLGKELEQRSEAVKKYVDQ
jgi:hypothetical protein